MIDLYTVIFIIVFYKGSRGKGKTLSMVAEAFNFYLQGYKIISNLKSLKFGEYWDMEKLLNFDNYNNLYDCVLLIDEVQLFFDSRNFKDEKNKSFSYFIMQSRKRNIHILCTAQFIDSVEKRFRQNMDFLGVPEYHKQYDVCEIKYYKITLLEDFNVNAQDLQPSGYCFVASEVFLLYDTFELL